MGRRTPRDFLFVFAGYTWCKLLAAACSDPGRKQTLVVRSATARTRTIKTWSHSTESLKFTVRAHTLNVSTACIRRCGACTTRCEPAVIISLNKQDKNVSWDYIGTYTGTRSKRTKTKKLNSHTHEFSRFKLVSSINLWLRRFPESSPFLVLN